MFGLGMVGAIAGFPQILEALENLEEESGHGKVMEHDKLAKSHGIVAQFIMES